MQWPQATGKKGSLDHILFPSIPEHECVLVTIFFVKETYLIQNSEPTTFIYRCSHRACIQIALNSILIGSLGAPPNQHSASALPLICRPRGNDFEIPMRSFTHV